MTRAPFDILIPVAGVAALFYDHVLTIQDEVRLIWLNPESGLWNRMSFMANRYMTEGLAVYVVYGKCFLPLILPLLICSTVLSGGTYSDEEQVSQDIII
jgi:hypothetical protein